MSEQDELLSNLKKIREKAPEVARVFEKVLGVEMVTTIDCKVCGRKNRIKPERLVHHCGFCKALLR